MDYENKHPILQKLEDYFKNTPKEQIDKDWSNILKETDPESYYERKYKKALEWMQSLYSSLHGATKEEAEHYFPELKENKSERVRKGLIKTISSLLDNTILYHTDITKEEALTWLEKQGEPIDKEKVLIGARKDVALSIMNFLDRNTLGMCLSNIECADLESAVIDSDWSKVYDYMKKKLEKQGEKKPDDKVEPKFKVGDFITNDYCLGKVIEITNDAYLLDTGQGIPFSCEHNAHLWTIEDAKDGDVLVHNDCPFIFMGIKDNLVQALEENLCDSTNPVNFGEPNIDSDYQPATREQRKLLFQKIKEAGYEWDSEKKELKKIEPKKLNADKVIEWLKNTIGETAMHFHAYKETRLALPYNSIEDFINDFKEDFGL